MTCGGSGKAPAETIFLKGLRCTACYGHEPAVLTCTHCRGRGMEPLADCPKACVTRDAIEAVDAAEDLEHGAGWPSGRGWMEEPASLVEAVRYARQLSNVAKAALIRNAFDR